MTPSVDENWTKRENIQNELREFERLPFASEEMLENFMESLATSAA